MHILTALICISLMFLSLYITTPQGKLEASSVNSLQALCFIWEEAKGNDDSAVVRASSQGDEKLQSPMNYQPNL